MDKNKEQPAKHKLNNQELFNFKKEYLFQRLEARRAGVENAFIHKWRIRILFAVLSVSFLGLCVTSKDFHGLSLNIPYYPQLVIVFIFLFWLYDAHESSLEDSNKEHGKILGDLLRKLPDEYHSLELNKIPSVEDLREGFWKRFWLRIRQFKKLDFTLFHLLMGLMWLLGWIIVNVKNKVC